jgi:hypothetical protein
MRAHNNRGVAYYISLLSLGVLTSIGVTMHFLSSSEFEKSDNYQEFTTARLSAESGLDAILYHLMRLRVPESTTPSTYPTEMIKYLPSGLGATAQTIGESNYLVVPRTYFDTDKSYALTVRMVSKADSPTTYGLEMISTGYHGTTTRRISLMMDVHLQRALVFDYGIATKGPLAVFGSSRVLGMNYPEEGSIMSATELVGVDNVTLSGSATVSGDVFAAGDTGNIVVDGNSVSIAGTTDSVERLKHCHEQVEMPDFPELETAEIISLATGTYDPDASVLKNVKIPANTNPTISKDITINGVLYIEAPNVVHMSGKVDLNGIIVTSGGSAHSITDCQIIFSGQVAAKGVENLPDEPDYDKVKNKTGTFILAEGFHTTFTGRVDAINGSIASDKLTFTGTAEGVIKGSVIGLKDGLYNDVGGNVDIYIDKENADEKPAGFKPSYGFEPDWSTYNEYTSNG